LSDAEAITLRLEMFLGGQLQSKQDQTSGRAA